MTTVVVKPNDMRVIYLDASLPAAPLLNFQGYAGLLGGGWLGECGSVTRLAAAGDTASLFFTGTSVEVTYMLESAGGVASISVDGGPAQEINTRQVAADVGNEVCHNVTYSRAGQGWAMGFIMLTSKLPQPGSFYNSPAQPPPTSQPPVATGDVQVLTNDTNLVYQAGQYGIQDFAYYVSGFSSSTHGFWEPTACGSYVDLWSYNDSGTLTFTGTAFTINLLRTAQGGSGDIYLDGNLIQSVDNTGANDHVGLSCDIAAISKSGLQPGIHNVIVVSGQIENEWFLVQSFVYIPSTVSTPSPNSSGTASPSPTPSGGRRTRP